MSCTLPVKIAMLSLSRTSSRSLSISIGSSPPSLKPPEDCSWPKPGVEPSSVTASPMPRKSILRICVSGRHGPDPLRFDLHLDALFEHYQRPAIGDHHRIGRDARLVQIDPDRLVRGQVALIDVDDRRLQMRDQAVGRLDDRRTVDPELAFGFDQLAAWRRDRGPIADADRHLR